MGNLYVVATPIGNLNDITKRAIETLKNVDIILCEDTRVSLKLLKNLEIKNKLISYHKFNEVNMTTKVIEDLKKGLNIALISDAGTPCISDPGYILVKKAKEENLKVIPIGGMCAFINAISISGLSSDKFTFCGFFPRETKEKNLLIKDIKSSKITTYAFYESPKRITKTLNYLLENLGNIKISVSRELTKMFETNYFGNLKEVLKEIEEDKNSSLGEYTFIIEKENEKETKEEISIPAQLVDVMIKENLTTKEAIKFLSETKNINKNEIYEASLKLKNILKWIKKLLLLHYRSERSFLWQNTK